MIDALRDQLTSALGSAFTLERELGGGGMSRVFVAQDARLGRQVVVKVLAPSLTEGLSAERFEREIRLAAGLQQANIVPVLHAGDAGGVPYYVMPFVEGESLRARLALGTALSLAEVVGILRDVARALAYAHARGIVHRDIKPDNVLVSGGTAVVTDFGIAKALNAARTVADHEAVRAATITQVGTSIGTPAYMAPEQAVGDPAADQRVDVYAFGCLAYELLTGRPPFAVESPQRAIAAHLSATPVPVAAYRADTPPVLADLLMRCLAKAPEDRPSTAGDLLQALESLTQESHEASATGGIDDRALVRVVAIYAMASIAVIALAWLATDALGLPDWVLPVSLLLTALGIPIIAATALVHHLGRRAQRATTPGGSHGPHGTLATLAVRAAPHMGWRQTVRLGGVALGLFGLFVAAFMTMRTFGVGPAASLLTAGRLSAGDPLLVADFEVRGTADSSLGTVVAEAVRADLGQSSVIALVPPSTIREALGRMQRSADGRFTAAIAREMAQREGFKGIVSGDLTPLGEGFIVTVRLATSTGDDLASLRETANTPGELIPTVERVTRRLRGRVGESFREVRASPPLAQVTTPSLAALRKYTEGVRALDYSLSYDRSVSLLQEAVALDTTFAMGWRRLAVAYALAVMPPEVVEDAATRAYRHRDRLPERERYLTEGLYFDRGPGRDRARAIEAYDAAIRSGVRGEVEHDLAELFRSRREFARAESLYRSRLAGGEMLLTTIASLGSTLFAQGRAAEAESLYADMSRRFPTFSPWAFLAFLQDHRGRLDSAERLLERQRTADVGTQRAGAFLYLHWLQLRQGRLTDAESNWWRGDSANVARGGRSDDIFNTVQLARIDIWHRDEPERAVARMDSAIARTPLATLPLMPPLERVPYRLIFARLYAQAGNPARARALLAQFDAEVKDTAMHRTFQPGRERVMGEILLAEGQPRAALDAFRRGARLPDGPANSCEICHFAEVGRAFDRANQVDSAISAFTRYLETPQLNRLEADAQFGAAILRRLGELHEQQGDRAQAAMYFERFVALRRDADAALQPEVAEMRRRLTRLRAATTR